jgi:hypothetical protein
MKNLSISALIAAGMLAGGISTASAADLGGNCCADLEERIAELEATTVRKGNRKVSLTVSGWVAEQVIVWDDGVEKNAYQTGIGDTLDSNFKFVGSAKITPDVTAGYVLHVELTSAANLDVSNAADDKGQGLTINQSYWFLKSEKLGRLSVGLQSSAYDNLALLPDGSGTLIVANYIMYDVNGFNARKGGALTGVNWGQLATCQSFNGNDAAGLSADCDGVQTNVVRYDTPTFMGFSASASWGEDDVWGVAGRFAGEFSGFKLAAAVGYYDNSDDNAGADKETFERARGGKKSSAMQVGAYIQHVPTGLFAFGVYGRDYNDVTGGLNALGQQQVDGENYYLKAGLRQKFTPFGATVLFGDYGVNNDKMSNTLWRAGATSSELTQWGLGISQEIDAAAMSMFLVYRNYEGEVNVTGNAIGARPTGITAGKNSFDEHQLVKFGAIINF